MKFTNSKKIWILNNIACFFRQDPYLKHLDNHVLIQTLKKQLKDNDSLESVRSNLGEEYFKPFKFYRKDEKFFIYPSIFTQISSLAECWDEIIKIKMLQDKNFQKAYVELDLDDLLDSETVEENLTDIDRRCFGQTPNGFSHYNLNIEAPLKLHVRSRVSYIKNNFTNEYLLFKKKVVLTCREVCKKGNSAFLLQTDIRSFFHTINTEDIISTLKKNYPKESIKICKSIKNIKQEINTSELPIGWILSGPISDIVLNLIQRELGQNTISYKSHFVNYVDDFVVVSEFNDNEKLDEEKLKKEIFNELKKSFSKVLESSAIQFHEDGEKIKTWKIDNFSLGVIDLTWFDMGDASIESDDNPKWSAVNEFLLPADNDLELNERIQFLENLKLIRNKVLNDEIRSWDQFEEYFKKIIFKLSRTGSRYIPLIVDTVMLFSRSNAFLEQECINRLERLYEAISQNHPNASTWLALFGSLKKYASTIELKNWIAAKAIAAKERFQCENLNDDVQLLESWINLFYYSNLKLIYKFKKTNTSAEEMFFTTEVFNALSVSEKLFVKQEISNSENEFLIINSLRLFHIAYENEREAPAHCVSVKDVINNNLYCRFLEEGLYWFSSFLSFQDLSLILINIKDEKFKCPNKSKIIFTIEALVDAKEDAEDIVYIKTVLEKGKAYNALIDSMYSRKKSKGYIEWLKDDDLMFASREMSIIYLFLAASVDHWKKIFFCKVTTFEYSNFISSWVFPNIYTELGILLFMTAKNILKINVLSVLSAKCSTNTNALLRRTIKIRTVGARDDLLPLNIDRILSRKIRSTVKQGDAKLVTIGHVSFDIDKDYTPENRYGHSSSTVADLVKKINQALTHAIKTRSTFLVFPELCVPLKELRSLLDKAGKNNIVLIAGVEARSDSEKKYRNTTVISIPVNRKNNPVGKPYLAFFQFKNYPAALEEYYLTKKGYHYIPGNLIYLFKSKILSSFSVLTCSDFLATKLKQALKTQIQILFVPAVNQDNSTYNVVSETCIRELFCCCVICNNSRKGTSLIMMPYKENYQRTVLVSHGLTLPGYSSVSIDINSLTLMQDLSPLGVEKARANEKDLNHELVKKFKQLPPDWRKAG